MPNDHPDDLDQSFGVALKPTQASDGDDDEPQSQKEKYENRFPQTVSVSDVVGKLLIEGNNTTLGRVKGIVRTKNDDVLLIIPYRSFLGLGGRLVAVPLNVVASIGTALVSVDMAREAYDTAPTWEQGSDVLLGPAEPIRVAITRH